jgi:hypothetical protein
MELEKKMTVRTLSEFTYMFAKSNLGRLSIGGFTYFSKLQEIKKGC